MGSSNVRRTTGMRGGPPDRISDCENVDIEALLASPQPAVLAKVVVNSILDITLDNSAGRRVVRVRLGTELLGSLTVSGLDKLIECIEKGYPFHGIVSEVSGPACRIWIRSGAAPK